MTGIAPAVWVVTQLTNPVVDHIRKKFNVILVVYIDDFIVIFKNRTEEEANDIFVKIVQEIESFGFQVNV